MSVYSKSEGITEVPLIFLPLPILDFSFFYFVSHIDIIFLKVIFYLCILTERRHILKEIIIE